MPNKIKLDHTRLPEPDCIARLREIITAMTGNAAFTAVGAKVTDLDTAVDVFEAKNIEYNASAELCSQLLTERDDLRGAAEDSARSLANASEGETEDEAALLSGGWHLRDAPTPIGELPAPQNLRATGGDLEGENDLQWDPVYGRDTYIADCSADAAGPWTQFYVGKKSSCTATGLVPGQLYWFRVRAVGPLGAGPWSDIAQKRAS
jgi:hypothetical protein